MAGLVDFTSFDDIRAVLGVSSDELEDATLSLDLYYFGLVSELEEMTPSPLSSYLDLFETDPEVMSEDELRFYRAMRVFASNWVAKELLPSLPVFAPREISDGKAGMQRVLDPYKAVREGVESGLERAALRLASAYAKLTAGSASTRVQRVFMGVAGLPVNPVTNE